MNLLMLAAIHGHDEVIRIIRSCSSNVKKLIDITGIVNDIHGNLVVSGTALSCACNRGDYTSARVLIEVGKANFYQGLGNPFLIDAVINERVDTIQFLIENHYVDINRTRASDLSHYNSLMLCAAHGQTQFVT